MEEEERKSKKEKVNPTTTLLRKEKVLVRQMSFYLILQHKTISKMKHICCTSDLVHMVFAWKFTAGPKQCQRFLSRPAWDGDQVEQSKRKRTGWHVRQGENVFGRE